MPTRERVTPQWLKWGLGALCLGAVVAAVLVVGPASAPATQRRLYTVARGVVQSSVSGSGTIQAATDDTVNFATSGTLKDVYVHVGQHVYAGQLLADLDPTDANLSLASAQANLSSADARLAQAEAGSSSSSSGGGSTPAASTTPSTTSASDPSSTTASDPSSTTAAQVAAAPVAFRRGSGSSGGSRGSSSGSRGSGSSSSRGGAASGSATSGGGSGASRSASAPASSSGSSSSTNSAATAANIQAAEAGVESAQVSVSSAQHTVGQTRLYAPTAGTVAAINASAGDSVAGGGSSPVSTTSSSSTSSAGGAGAGAGAGGAGGAAAGAGGNGSSSATGSSGSASGGSSNPFIQLVDLSGFSLQVPFSEADIHNISVGQPATVTVNALPGQELAAHVTGIATLSTTNSGVVSYDVTIQLDQSVGGLKPGMTATANVVTSQVDGAINLPSAAISGRAGAQTVNLVQGGKTVLTPVVTGLVGDNTTQVVTGVSPGQQVAVTVNTSALSGGAGATGAAGAGGAAGRAGGFGGGGLGGGIGGGGLGGGGGGFVGPGGGGGFRGGGG